MESIMSKLLALAAIVALVAACTGLSHTGGQTELGGPGAVGAADLGYHGPVHRNRILYGN
jgi:hypothetical protein